MVTSFGVTNFLIPIISLIVSFITRSFEKKEPLNVAEITGRRFLGYE